MLKKVIDLLNIDSSNDLSKLSEIISTNDFGAFNEIAKKYIQTNNQFNIININNEKFGLLKNNDIYLFENYDLKIVSVSDKDIVSIIQTPFLYKKNIQEGIQIKKENGTFEKFVVDDDFKNQFIIELQEEGYDSDLGIEILNLIENNKDQFQYEYIGQMKNEIKFRLSSIEIMSNQIKQIDKFTGFGEWSTDALSYWDVDVEGANTGFTLKKESETTKNLNPSDALDALINPDNKLRVDCSTALAVLEFLALKKELEEIGFNKLFKYRSLSIQPLVLQHDKNTKKFREVDLTILTESTDKDDILDQLVPGDRGYIQNYFMIKDPYVSEYVLYIGKKNGEHHFRGHPFKNDLTYKALKILLTNEYERWLEQHSYAHDEREIEEKQNYNTIGDDIPGLYKMIERPDINKLRNIY